MRLMYLLRTWFPKFKELKRSNCLCLCWICSPYKTPANKSRVEGYLYSIWAKKLIVSTKLFRILKLDFLCTELGLRSMNCDILISNCFGLIFIRTCAHNLLHLCLGQNEIFLVSVLVLQPISTKYWLGSWLVPSNEIRLNRVELLRSWTE
jgi:hypothetical protein